MTEEINEAIDNMEKTIKSNQRVLNSITNNNMQIIDCLLENKIINEEEHKELKKVITEKHNKILKEIKKLETTLSELKTYKLQIMN